MRDEAKTKAQLIHELAELRQRLTTLEARETKHKQVEMELQQVKEFSESLIENMAEGIAVEDTDGYFTFVNPAAATMLGYTPEELLGQHWTVIVPPDQHPIVQAADERRARGQADRYDLKLVGQGGTPLFVQVSGSPQFDATGRFTGTLAVFTDVTERKRAEEALRESEMKFRSLVEASPDVIVLTDLNATITMVNKQAVVLPGYEDAEELIGKSAFDFIAPEDWPRAMSNMQKTLETGSVRDIEYTLLRKDGARFSSELSASLIRDLEGKPQAFTAVLRDITARKQAEEALRQSEERLELALDSANLGLWDVNIPTGEQITNQRAAAMLGYTTVEIEPTISWWDQQTHADDMPHVQQAWDAHLTGKTPAYESEYRLRTKLGEWIWILDRGKVVMWDEAGNPLRATGTYLDISERKQAEEALQQRNRELALLNQASQAFNSSLDLGEVLVNILEEVWPLLRVVGASIWLNDSQTDQLVCHQAAGVYGEALRGWHLPAGKGIVGWVTQHGQSQIVPDVQKDARYFKPIQEKIGLELRSILCVPLRSKLTVIGALEVVDTTADRFSQTDLTLVESLAATATIAIENARLYEQMRQDAETKAALLEEVNHRVKNNLAAIIGLLHLEQRHMQEEDQAAYQGIMQDLVNRIQGLATAHHLLSTANWSSILLSELATKVIHSALQALPLDKYVSVEVSPSSIQIVPKLANTLALIINELTTNTVKYAWSEVQTGHIAVHLDEKDDEILLEFRDDGPGYPEEVLRLERYSVGLELIQSLVRHGLQGEISLHNDQGAVTTIRFPSFI